MEEWVDMLKREGEMLSRDTCQMAYRICDPNVQRDTESGMIVGRKGMAEDGRGGERMEEVERAGKKRWKEQERRVQREEKMSTTHEQPSEDTSNNSSSQLPFTQTRTSNTFIPSLRCSRSASLCGR